MIADNLPEAGLSIEDCVMQVMANLAVAYADELDSYQVPFIEDPAIEGNNLAGKYCYNDFAQIVYKLNEHLSHLADEEPATVSGSKYLETTSHREALRAEPRHQLSQKSTVRIVCSAQATVRLPHAGS